jgi:hypothetical protein
VVLVLLDPHMEVVMSRTRTRQPARRTPRRPARLLWQIDMGDGTHAAVCMACSTPLYRGNNRTAAERAIRAHVCEPVVPLGRTRRGGRR